MTLHIGIVGCSAEGAALCYRTICTEGPGLMGEHAHPQVSMHTSSLAEYVRLLDHGDLAGVGELMLDSARRLAAAGADFLVCPDNTVHQAFEHVARRSPLPWLHIADVVAEAAAARGMRRLGVTGTRWLVDSSVYPDALARHGLECVLPTAVERDEMNRVIMHELVKGMCRPEAAGYFQRAGLRMREAGCDGLILGCTEIPLVINDGNAPLPTLDSTRLLARAALRRAVQSL